MNGLRKYIKEIGLVKLIKNYSELQIKDVLEIIYSNSDNMFCDTVNKLKFMNVSKFNIIICAYTAKEFIIININNLKKKCSIYEIKFDNKFDVIEKEAFAKLLSESVKFTNNNKFLYFCLELFSITRYVYSTCINKFLSELELNQYFFNMLYGILDEYKIITYNIKFYTNSLKLPNLNNLHINSCEIQNIFPKKIVKNISINKKLNRKNNKILVSVLIQK
jgi:hypothetical protein